MKDILIKKFYESIPKILSLCDRNPFSKTFGCFDKNYWHFKTIDFPSSMYQECVLPLAQAYILKDKKNPYHKKKVIKKLCIGSINFSNSISKSNGSTDDYFPNEQAYGSSAFSLYADTETYLILGLKNRQMNKIFINRAMFLINNSESGNLSNHHALAILSIYNVYLITNDSYFLKIIKKKIKDLLKWQNEEGWFEEYGEFDLGYLTKTICFLSKYYLKSKDKIVKIPLIKSINFCLNFLHKDGSFGGEYSSRSSYHFHVSGFEICSKFINKSTLVTDHFIKSILRNKNSIYGDDRIFSHSVYDYFDSYRYFNKKRYKNKKTKPLNKYFPMSGIYIFKNNKYDFICNLKKGLVIKAYNKNKCVFSDTNPVLKFKNKILCSNRYDKNDQYSIDLKNKVFFTKKKFTKSLNTYNSPLKIIFFRLINLTISKFFPNFIRKLLQKIIIYSSDSNKILFFKEVKLNNSGFKIIYKISGNKKNLSKLNCLYLSTHLNPIYTAASYPYQETFINLEDKSNKKFLDQLRQKGEIKITKTINV